MVTYLAIFVVCDFVYVGGETPSTKIPMRVSER